MREESRKILNDLINSAVDAKISNSGSALIKITPKEIKYSGSDVYIESLAARMERMEKERIHGEIVKVKVARSHDLAVNLTNVLVPCLVITLVGLAIVNAVKDSQRELHRPIQQERLG